MSGIKCFPLVACRPIRTPISGPKIHTANPVGMACRPGTGSKEFFVYDGWLHAREWEHVNLTANDIWNIDSNVTENHDGLRPLRPVLDTILLAAQCSHFVRL